MNKITTIIVDDEEKAREVLDTLLKRNCPDVNVISKCNNLLNAVEQIKLHSPDLVFLDIQMPEYAGYEITNFIDKIDFDIIFVTAFNEFAIKAFELSALDYLLKPIDRNRLKEAVAKVQEKKEKALELKEYKALLNNMQNEKNPQIVISEAIGKRVVKLNDILAIEGQRAYSNIMLRNNTSILASKNLKYFENLLKDKFNFFRCHKSWIINLNEIEKIVSSEQKLLLSNNNEIKVSPQKIKELQQLISSL